MHTRISVQKLYTKSKALYIQIQQVVAFLSTENHKLKVELVQLYSQESLQHELSTRPDSIQTLQTKKTLIIMSQNRICFYINTKNAPSHQHYTQLHPHTLHTYPQHGTLPSSMLVYTFSVHNFTVWWRFSMHKYHLQGLLHPLLPSLTNMAP